MLPAAPGRLSTITGWPHFSVSFSATMRGIRSALPPAGNGTTMPTALAGQSCARAALARNIATAAAASGLMRSTETPEHSYARHVVDVDAVLGARAADFLVALPIEANPQVAEHIPLQPRAVGHVAIRVIFDAAH